ncbi:MAG: hypothetical protein ACK5P5_11450 [Pseudobdellovibrionaceae bacterium]
MYSLTSFFPVIVFVLSLALVEVVNGQATVRTDQAQVIKVISQNEILVRPISQKKSELWNLNDTAIVRSSYPGSFDETIAVFTVKEIKIKPILLNIEETDIPKKKEKRLRKSLLKEYQTEDIHYVLEVKYLSRKYLIQPYDLVTRVFLENYETNYIATTDLIVRKSDQNVSSRYRLLLTQGQNIETAETLWQKESLLFWYGLYYYGLTDRISLGTLLPGYFVQSPNLSLKTKIHNGSNNLVAMGLTAVKLPNQPVTTLNFNFMWDAINSDSNISHTFLSFAFRRYQEADDRTYIKAFGNTTLQTGHEFLLSNWSRILIGPNFNVENKTIGGYLAWVKMWDRFHLQVSLNSTNIQSVKLSDEDGYYPVIDAYWRF